MRFLDVYKRQTGALADPKIDHITPAVVETVNAYLKHDFPVLAFRDCHNESAKEFSSFPPHCLKAVSYTHIAVYTRQCRYGADLL